MKKTRRLLCLLLTVVLALSLCAIPAAAADDQARSDDPVVFVHGLLGWGQRDKIYRINRHKGIMLAVIGEKSLAEGRVTFYSRTRQCLWTKGETSGNRLDIVSVAADCDRDTLLIRAVPHGPTCHTGTQSCFGEAVPETEGFIRRLQAVIRQRHAAMPEGSYTARLFTRGVNKIAQKVGEEAVETVIEAVAGNREAMIYEASDLVYHLLVLLEATGCSIADLEKELARRHS